MKTKTNDIELKQTKIIHMTYLALGFLAFLGIVFVCVSFGEVSAKAECEFVIDYGINESLDCWDKSIDPKHCPLPSKVHCSIEGTAPLIAVLGGA